MDAKEFKQRMGRLPRQDDLNRVNCEFQGEVGHSSCGWCDECDHPRFECLCPRKGKIVFMDNKLVTELSDMEFYNSIKNGY